MIKEIRQLIILSIILLVISTIVVFSFGREYDVIFKIHGDYKHNITIDDESSGEIDIIDKKIINNKYIIRCKAKKHGKVIITIDNGDYSENAILYIHKSLIITDNNFFGKSTCSEVIPISLIIVIIDLLYILIKVFIKSLNDNLFQYKNIAYLGIVIFIILFLVNIFASIFNYRGILNTIDNILNAFSFFSFSFLPVIFISFILVSISNIVLFIKEGKSLKNLLGILFGFFICSLTILPDIVYRLLMTTQSVNIYNLNSIGPYLYKFVEMIVYLTVSYIECIFISTVIIAIISVKRKVKYNKDYMIILGCKIRNDGTLPPLLKGRVEKAIEFRTEQINRTGKDLIFIPSGGKGKDEVISEAAAIKKYLLDHNIKEKNIILEDKSTNTFENIKYSNKLITKKTANICFSTTNYHVLRAGLIATSQGLKIDGIGSKTRAYYWVNAFIREFIGTLYYEKKKHVIVLIVILIGIIFMIGVTYLSNII